MAITRARGILHVVGDRDAASDCGVDYFETSATYVSRLGDRSERYHRSWTGELCLRDKLRNQRLIELGWEVKRFWVYEIRGRLPECVAFVGDWVSKAQNEK